MYWSGLAASISAESLFSSAEKAAPHSLLPSDSSLSEEIPPLKMPLGTVAHVLALVLLSASIVRGQMAPNPLSKPTPNPLTDPTLSPGTAFLFNLEAKFAQDTATGGGKVFASWFADDAVTLETGEAAVIGKTAIAAKANWDPTKYQLTWTPQGGQMSLAGDM